MGISETKKQIVIDNYFKNTCNVNTSIKEAFTKGFEVGLTKAVFPKDQYEARLKADMVAMLTEIHTELEELEYLDGEEPINITQDYLDELKSWDYGKKDCIKVIQQKIDNLKEE